MMSLALLASISFANARLTPGAMCPKNSELTLQNDFDHGKYMGLWYEQARDDQLMVEWFHECVTDRYFYYPYGDKKYIRVVTSLSNWFTMWFPFSVEYPAACDETEPGQCYVLNVEDFYTNGNKPGKFSLDYKLLKTDYTDSAWVYSCTDTPGGKQEHMWLIMRDKQVDDDRKRELLKEFKTLTGGHYDAEGSHLTYQGDLCVYN